MYSSLSESFEPGFDVGVVVADLGTAVAGCDAVFGVEGLEGFGCHHGAIVSVDDLDFARGGSKDFWNIAAARLACSRCWTVNPTILRL